MNKAHAAQENCTASMIARGVVARVITIAVGIYRSSHFFDPEVLRFTSRSPIQVCWGLMVPIIRPCCLLDQIARTKKGQSFFI